MLRRLLLRRLHIATLPNGDVFSRQFWLFSNDNFTVMLCKIVNPDPYYAAHNHYAGFVSLILSGGYIERIWTPNGWDRAMCGPGDVLIRTTRDVHSIITVLPNTWTLRVTGRDTENAAYYGA